MDAERSGPRPGALAPKRWHQIESIVDAALERSAERRLAYVNEACGSDALLRREVESLLVVAEQTPGFLELPALELIRAQMRSPPAAELGESEPERLPAGFEILPYRIVAFLGSGGMGEVYQAAAPQLGGDVALKFLPKQAARNPLALERFKREARAASLLNHPNICALYDIGEYESRPFMVLELLEGKSLKQRLAAGPLRLKELIDVALQIADALSAAHSIGIIHRDIKPANIFLTERGLAKILDFGLVKLLWEPCRLLPAAATGGVAPAGADTISLPGAIMGTVAYMSPEQARGQEVDLRTDVFSLGVTLYQMATGRLPFQAATPPDTMEELLTKRPVPPREVNPLIPPELEQIVLKALAKGPDLRYQHAADLRADLEALKRVVERQQIAVLPFANLSGDPTTDLLAEGFAEELITALARSKELRVVAGSSSLRFKEGPLDLSKVAEVLGVTAIVEGSVRRSATVVRVTARLVDVRSGFELWSASYDKPIGEALQINEEIAAEICAVLKTPPSVPTRRLVDGENAELCLKGRSLAAKRTPWSSFQALHCYERAVETDPGCAEAWAGIAECYTWLALFGLDPIGANRKAHDAARRAVELDEGSAAAHLAYGLYHYSMGWDWQIAEREMRRALELSPGSAVVREWLTWVLTARGRLGEALLLACSAIALNPLSASVHTAHANVFYVGRRYPEAERAFQSALGVVDPNDPNFLFIHGHLGLVYLAQQRYPEAVRSLSRAVELARVPPVLACYGLASALNGNGEEMDRVFSELKNLTRAAPVPPVAFALIYAGLGKADLAFDCLEEAYELRCPLFHWVSYPLFDLLRPDPRLPALLRRAGLPAGRADFTPLPPGL